MEEFLSRHGFLLLIMLPAILGAVSALVIKVAAEWRKARQAECEAVLKQEMVQRGMSADDIVRVLQAGKSPTVESTEAPIGPRMAEKAYEAADIGRVVQVWERLPTDVRATVRAMVEEEYDAEDIAKIVAACPAREPSPSNGEQKPSLAETTDYKG
jgi:hypothetical protein